MEQSAGFAVYGGRMDIKSAIEASRSTTWVADVFRAAVGLPKLSVQERPRKRRRRSGKKYVNYAKLMDNRYSATDRHGKA